MAINVEIGVLLGDVVLGDGVSNHFWVLSPQTDRERREIQKITDVACAV